MSEEERSDSTIQDYVNDLRMRRGACPDNETIDAFQQGTLGDEMVGKVRTHVEMCGLCQMKLRVLKKFDECKEAEFEVPGDWPVIEQRTRERFYAFLGSQAGKGRAQEGQRSVWVRVRAVFAHPALAYVLVLVLLYPAYRGLFRKPEVVKETIRVPEVIQVEKPAPAIASLRSFELTATERAATEGRTVVRLSSDEESFGLSFFVPISERPEFVYDLEIRDGQGGVVGEEKAARAQDKFGNFLLECRREYFPSGEYELRIKEVNKTTQVVRREYTFFFAVEEK